MATLRELSKQSFDGNSSLEHINAGSLQRIADATELMAKNYLRMEEDLKFYKTKYMQKSKEIEVMENRISAYKGVITKLKKKDK